MTCKACIHWESLTGLSSLGEDDGGEPAFGKCRRHPPRINDAVLALIFPRQGLTGGGTDEGDVSNALHEASLFPITFHSDRCGEFNGGSSC